MAYSPAMSLGIAAILLIGSQIVGAVLFGFLLLMTPGFSGLDGAAVEQKILSNTWLYMTLIAIIEAMVIGGVYWALKRIKMPLRKIGVGSFKPQYILYGVVGYVFVLATNVLVLTVLSVLFSGVDFSQEQSLSIAKDVSGTALWPLFFALVILVPVTEELLMRGFLFTNLRARLEFVWAAVLTSAFFGLAHITQVDEGLFISGAVSFFVLSMVLCWLREKTASIWPPILVHMMQNGIAFWALYLH